MLEVHLLTLFPDAVDGYLRASILGRAQEAGKLRIHVLDFRRFTTDRHRSVDDRPFGGGPGMVLKPEPIFQAVEWVEREFGPCHRILLTPDGAHFTQARAQRLSAAQRLLLLCGRYEGFDERVRAGLEWEELSLGDFVLSGGEIAALAVIEATVRLIPGVLGDDGSAVSESFTADPDLLDHPHYTRPVEFRGMAVPEVLRSGNHAQVARWRREQAERRTRERRPDLIGPQ
ncbi:MAG: tRNA (guanosine(37)-N1)-methyltransferase TrmD [Planctomycetota bacterium]|nr:MAG: tRNA (guanosine(37)-N1)-methyltransferase TrmD [Planctomycetota bacterium]